MADRGGEDTQNEQRRASSEDGTEETRIGEAAGEGANKE
jgi:hypothetical protein